MDNITHSLAGLMLGDAAVALRERFAPSNEPSGPRFRAAALTTSVFANNAPDLDFLYSGITGGKLGYLLHHRGHTHTFAAVLPLALFCLALVALLFRRQLPVARWDRASLIALAVIGGVVHVTLDLGNNYGVHPFWPVYDGWFYGDAIFIIEPWLMLLLIGMAVGVSRSRALRGALLTLLLGLIALIWVSELTSPLLAGALTACGLGWVGALWRAGFRARWTAGGVATALLWSVLLATRYEARASVRDALATAPALQLLDVVSTPAPGNPLCWSVLAVQRSDHEYVVRQGLASGWPALSSAGSCRFMNRGQTAQLTAPRAEEAPAAPERLIWGPEFRAPLAELARVRHENCVARAFLRFARVPFWIDEDSRPTLIGDLRYDRSSAVEFSEVVLAPDAPCPRFEPPWLPPLDMAER